MNLHAATDHSSFESVTQYFEWDHDRLDALLGEVRQMVEDGELERAETRYDEFLSGLLRHIRLEEHVLFPLFEERTGVTMGPTEVMRREHRLIERALEVMQKGLGGGHPEPFFEGLSLLIEVLPDHNAKEERVLYPMIDNALSDAERSGFVARLQSE